VEYPGLDTFISADVATGETVTELRTQDYQLAARVRYSPSPPEGLSTEFVVNAPFQADGLGKSLIIQMLHEMRDQGCTTARLVSVTDRKPFIKYGCSFDGPDAIVDLVNGQTLSLLESS
jgi:hypothetical protein